MYQIISIIVVFFRIVYSQENVPETTDLVVRQKRQYYICGQYPNRFYSMYPCEVWFQTTRRQYDPNTCSNGGRKIGVGCYFDYQCTPYSSAQTVCLQNCCCSIPTVTNPPFTLFTTTRATTTQSVANLAYCYNGQRTQVRCTTSVDCSAGQTCINGICCTTTGNEWSGACGGLPAIASCASGRICGSFTCTTSNYCCECPFGRTAGSCLNGCPSGYTCNTATSYCCATCFSGQTPYGSCFNGLCANGYTCQPGNICC